VEEFSGGIVLLDGGKLAENFNSIKQPLESVIGKLDEKLADFVTRFFELGLKFSEPYSIFFGFYLLLPHQSATSLGYGIALSCGNVAKERKRLEYPEGCVFVQILTQALDSC